MFPISACLDEAIAQGRLLCGTLWLLFRGSASFIKLRCEGDSGQWSRPFARPRGWASEKWYNHLASSRAALKSLLLQQNSNCCGSRRKDETGWNYDLFYDLCPTRSKKFRDLIFILAHVSIIFLFDSLCRFWQWMKSIRLVKSVSSGQDFFGKRSQIQTTLASSSPWTWMWKWRLWWLAHVFSS